METSSSSNFYSSFSVEDRLVFLDIRILDLHSGSVGQKILFLNIYVTLFLFRRGQIAGKMNDETLRQLLTRFSENTRQTTTVKVHICTFSL